MNFHLNWHVFFSLSILVIFNQWPPKIALFYPLISCLLLDWWYMLAWEFDCVVICYDYIINFITEPRFSSSHPDFQFLMSPQKEMYIKVSGINYSIFPTHLLWRNCCCSELWHALWFILTFANHKLLKMFFLCRKWDCWRWSMVCSRFQKPWNFFITMLVLFIGLYHLRLQILRLKVIFFLKICNSQTVYKFEVDFLKKHYYSELLSWDRESLIPHWIIYFPFIWQLFFFRYRLVLCWLHNIYLHNLLFHAFLWYVSPGWKM